MNLTETIESLLNNPELHSASARRILEIATSHGPRSGVHPEHDLIERLKKFLYNMEALAHPERGGLAAARLLAVRKIDHGDWPQEALDLLAEGGEGMGEG